MKVIATLPEDHYTSISSRSRAKSWIKNLDRVDTTKSDGYAFVGQFARFGATVEIPVGSYYLAYEEDVSSAGKLRGRAVYLYRVKADGEWDEACFELDESYGWALKVRDKIAEVVNGSSREGLEQEKAALLVRLAEIDALLGDQ